MRGEARKQKWLSPCMGITLLYFRRNTVRHLWIKKTIIVETTEVIGIDNLRYLQWKRLVVIGDHIPLLCSARPKVDGYLWMKRKIGKPQRNKFKDRANQNLFFVSLITYRFMPSRFRLAHDYQKAAC
jgi:nicotinic acid mononucleotide adenylyltransferase